MTTPERLHITLPEQGYAPTRAAQAVQRSGLAQLMTQRAAGPFGMSAHGVATLEIVRDAVDVGLAAAEGLRGLILAQHSGDALFHIPTLAPEHRQLIATFQLITTADALDRRLTQHLSAPNVEGALDLDGLPELLARDQSTGELAARVLKLATAYASMKAPAHERQQDHALGAAVLAFMRLMRAALLLLSQQSATRPLLASLERCDITVAGYPYRGLEVREITQRADGLLDVKPDAIVGNAEYLAAGMRLARDVAAYDFERGANPKQLNPVLFGLGRPGCGKTVTAHAVGNYFLEYCAERGVPARFLIIQRTDWASSYQNASAMNLVRIFREEVYGKDGVCGVYWPDIDTAFASRSSGQLRGEEKQNLGAVFGIFDGTLLPRDGKWFLMCDANTMHMDEATVSRIAQNPMTVHGPTSPDDYVRLMRDLMLRDLKDHLDLSDDAWGRLGARVAALDLSGRNVDAICRNIRAHIQDFELPDAYFHAPSARRAEIVASLCHTADEAACARFIEDWVTFRQDADREAEEARFKAEVEALTRQLNATRAVMGGPASPPGPLSP